MASRWHTLEIWAQRLGLLLTACLLCACSRATPTPTPLPPAPTIAVPTTAATVSPVSPTVAASPTDVEGEEIGGVDITPVSPSNGIAREGAIFTSPRYSYTLMLPCCWLALPTPGTAIESALADLEAGNDIPMWGDLSERVRDRESGAVLELIALLPAEENATVPVAQVTVSVLPANGLTLEGYLEATEAELNSIANTTVLTAQIEATLGVEALPASVIEYTAAPTPAAEGVEETIAGFQVAFLGHSAENFIVLTFTTTTERYAALQPEFLRIVRMVTLDDPAV